MGDYVDITVTILGGGLTFAGIAYPYYAPGQPGWKIGAEANTEKWAIWFLAGAIAFFWAMFHLWRWWGLLVALPIAFVAGLVLTVSIGRNVQLAAYAGPVICVAAFFLTSW